MGWPIRWWDRRRGRLNARKFPFLSDTSRPGPMRRLEIGEKRTDASLAVFVGDEMGFGHARAGSSQGRAAFHASGSVPIHV